MAHMFLDYSFYRVDTTGKVRVNLIRRSIQKTKTK